MDFVTEYLPKAHWTEKTAISWLGSKAHSQGTDVAIVGSLEDMLERCSLELRESFCQELQDRSEMTK